MENKKEQETQDYVAKYYEEQRYTRKYSLKYQNWWSKKMINLVKPNGKILDVGCGTGYFAEKFLSKYDVTGIDISKTLIKNLKNYARNKKIKINLICKDIEKYNFTKKYDIIIMMGILHFIPKSKINEFLRKVKSHTTKNGINIIFAFREGDISQDNTSEGYYFKDKELLTIYKNWKIINYKEGVEKADDGKHKIVEMVAMRK